MDSSDRAGADLLTPTRVRELLDSYGLAPRKSAGQNFVVDPNTVRKVVRDAAVTSDDLVVEVGAGLGSLTLALATAAREVIAVEIDSGFVRALSDVLEERENVTLLHADVLDVDLAELTLRRRCRVVANLPYNVATPIVFHALDSQVVSDLFVMVQREVGERWAAKVGDDRYGAVSIKIALAADVEIVDDVPRTVFFPVPNVDSVTVRIVRRTTTEPPAVRHAVAEVVDAGFAQRRKTLRNALSVLHDRDRIEAACRRAGIDPGARAEELGPVDFRRLTVALGRLKGVVSDEAAPAASPGGD